jgi:mono/diheme cytochrome c family protein
MRTTARLPMALMALLFSGVAFSQSAAPSRTSDFGKREFEANCASCHGVNGKGNGPLVGFLSRSPTDLTLLAKKNQGVFPMSRLYDVIDGEGLPAHGSRDMPVWGREYRIKDAEYYVDTPYPYESMVRARLLSLLEYINRMQER